MRTRRSNQKNLAVEMKISIVIPKGTDNLAYVLDNYANCNLEEHRRELILVDDDARNDAVVHAFMKNLKVHRKSNQIFKTWFEADFPNHSISRTLEGVEPEVEYVRSSRRISKAGSVLEGVGRCTGDVIVLHGCSHPCELLKAVHPVARKTADVVFAWDGSVDLAAKACGMLFGKALCPAATRVFSARALKSLPLDCRYNVDGEIVSRVLLSGGHRIEAVKAQWIPQSYSKLSCIATMLLFWLRRDLRRKIGFDELYRMAEREGSSDAVLGFMRNVEVGE